MKNRKTVCLVLILVALFVISPPAFSQKNIILSRWTDSPAVIDASDEEWQGEALFSEEKAGAEYFLRNDSDNLYLLFIIKDKNFLSSLEGTGITVYFNTEGKKKKDSGLRFFKRIATADEIIQVLESRGQALSEEQKEQLKASPSFFLYDFETIQKKKDDAEEARPDGDSQLPTFKYATKGEMTVFEFRVPLSQEDQPFGIGVEPGGTLKLGFEWGGLTQQMKAARMARAAGTSERSAEGETKSDSHARDSSVSARGVPSSGGIPKAGPKTYSFWIDVRLAESQE